MIHQFAGVWFGNGHISLCLLLLKGHMHKLCSEENSKDEFSNLKNINDDKIDFIAIQINIIDLFQNFTK